MAATATDPGQSFDALLDFVKESRGFDFTGYRRSSIERRVAKRMGEVAIERYDDYIEHLRLHGDEFAELFNMLLINVTGFFRDPQTWEYLATDVLPPLVAARPMGSSLRVWSAGCASGEEAYTVAMVLARVLGEETFRERVKIYATDVDETALDVARLGAYLPRQIEGVPREALERFFDHAEQHYVFRRDLRRCMIFGRNDLVQDAPISRIDLLVCRNTLMYFTADTQSQILRRFHFALDDEGALLLGKSEMLIAHADLFTSVDLKRRVFRKVIRPALRDRVRVLAADADGRTSEAIVDNLREAAFDITSAAQVVLNAAGVLIVANASARRLLNLSVNDFGRPIQDLELSCRPIELRGHLESVASTRRGADFKAVRWGVGDEVRVLDVHLAPMLADGTFLGTSISYIDVTESNKLQDQVATARRELEKAYGELRSTVEELETTNEELQSTNEELGTTNEELQSTNEELETLNEELQSTNEELETMNDELRHRTLELDELNAFRETVLTMIGFAVAVIDGNQHVQIWNSQARDLWGLTSEEVEHQHLQSLDFGLPVERLKQPLRIALTGDSNRQELILPAVNRRDEKFECRITLMPLGSKQDGHGSGVIMMMERVDGVGP